MRCANINIEQNASRQIGAHLFLARSLARAFAEISFSAFKRSASSRATCNRREWRHRVCSGKREKDLEHVHSTLHGVTDRWGLPQLLLDLRLYSQHKRSAHRAENGEAGRHLFVSGGGELGTQSTHLLLESVAQRKNLRRFSVGCVYVCEKRGQDAWEFGGQKLEMKWRGAPLCRPRRPFRRQSGEVLCWPRDPQSVNAIRWESEASNASPITIFCWVLYMDWRFAYMERASSSSDRNCATSPS